MISNKNLWGELPNTETIRTPYSILKEQASILSEITNGLLIGEVIFYPPKGDLFVMILRIKTPSLNNYTYSVVEVQHKIKIYPVLVMNLASDENQGFSHCSSEEEFEKALGEILSSQEVKKVISVLLAQIQADIPKH